MDTTASRIAIVGVITAGAVIGCARQASSAEEDSSTETSTSSTDTTGDGTDTGEPDEPLVLGGPVIDRFTVGNRHVCAIAEGLTWCWGDNAQGQLGDGTLEASVRGVHPDVSVPLVDVSAGSYHTCAVDMDGTAWCWGDSLNGVLGDGLDTPSATPVQAVGLPPSVAISTEFVHTCALTGEGEVWCWGENNQGQLGTGEVSFAEFQPVQVPDLQGITQISVGERHTCALRDDATVWCWGDNSYGELGDGTRIDRDLPTQVPVCVPESLDAGSFRTCVACQVDQTLQCFGDNAESSLVPDGDTWLTVPTEVPGGVGGRLPSSAWRQTCSIEGEGGLSCWGTNRSGEPGVGHFDPVPPGPLALGIADPLHVATSSTPSGRIACVSLRGGGLACAGDTSEGHLGDVIVESTPVFVGAQWGPPG